MLLLVTGSAGFIGSFLCSYLGRHFDVLPTDVKGRPGSFTHMDVRERQKVLDVLRQHRPDAVLHLAAIKDVGYCERLPEEALRINLEGTRNVLEACNEVQAFLAFLSSDHVFDGTRGMYAEDAPREPTTVYGKSKKEAEDSITASGMAHAICRSGGVYGHSPDAPGLLSWAAERMARGEVINAFSNVYNTPTSLYDLGAGLQRIIQRRLAGVFHIAGAQRANRFEFLREYAIALGYRADLVVPEPYQPPPPGTSEGPPRPMDLSLDARRTASQIGVTFHTVREGFKALQQLE